MEGAVTLGVALAHQDGAADDRGPVRVRRRAVKMSAVAEGRALALLLDTRDVPPDARRDAVHDAYLRADVPRQVALTSQEAVDSTRLHAWMLGSTKLFCPESPGMDVRRDSASGRLDPMIALCVQTRGTATSIEDAREQHLLPGDLVMISPTSPNQFVIVGATAAIEIPFDEVGVSVETAAVACERLPGSPLFALVAGHLRSLPREADAMSASVGAAGVGAATALLVRALIVSAARDERSARAVVGDALGPRIFAYVRQHLTDRDLTPLKIARAHNISVRYLYKMCDAADVRLMEWIIEERLEGAHRDLSAPDAFPVSVARVARKWGFSDASHFTRRFHRTYGVAPSELLRHSRRQDRH
ncbi:MAG: AraC family transcriptional regulator [Acidimicrobiales bacterium]|nr:AraC family transcriptional regulator [Acidimicrobiales bacterium]